MADNKHLTLSQRIEIQTQLTNGISRAEIARFLDKDKSSICKEVKLHSTTVPFSRSGVSKKGTYDCQKTTECGYNAFCKNKCNDRVPFPCKRRDRKVGVCNGCDELGSCKLDKKIYNAETAHDNYTEILHDSREGVNLTTSQAFDIGNIIKPLLNNGQSIHAILVNHPEIDRCEKTIYNYIEDGVFSINGIANIDLRMKSSRKISRKKIKSKPRENRKYLENRTYDKFQEYIHNHPWDEKGLVEMDTVYNDVSKGPFIQTFQFVEYGLMIAFIHKEKTAFAMLEGVKKLNELLGDQLFAEFVKVLLTDRGSEFTSAEDIEKLGCRIFYCDPMCSWQKPHVENNHKLLRYICPKEADLEKLGLVDQKDLDLTFSHINSYIREELHDKSPIEVFQFYHPESKFLELLNIKKIDSDNITLNPNLLKK